MRRGCLYGVRLKASSLIGCLRAFFLYFDLDIAVMAYFAQWPCCVPFRGQGMFFLFRLYSVLPFGSTRPHAVA